MNREIRFKAWDNKDKIFWNQFHISSMYGSAIFGDQTKDWILIQFTGFKDKNGNDVYENDIIKITSI